MTAWDFPHAVDGRGRTASTTPRDHVRDLVEQVLLTAPDERVMRPQFGAGLLALVMEPTGPEVAATVSYLVQGALAHALGDRIAVGAVEVDTTVDGVLTVSVAYTVRGDGSAAVADVRLPTPEPSS